MYSELKDLVLDLEYDYQRMSTSGKETYEKICEILNIE